MGSKKNKSIALFLVLNLVFFTTLSSACDNCPPHSPKRKPQKPQPKPCPPPASPSRQAACPRDALKFGACGDLLGFLMNYTIGTPPKTPCCSLMNGMIDFEVAICLCTALKANVLGIDFNIPISLTMLLNVCSKNAPPDFNCD